MATPRLKCSNCDKRVPEDETVLVSGRRAGSYNRSTSACHRRVCLTCVKDRLEFYTKTIAEGRTTTFNNHYIDWQEAAKFFKIDLSSVKYMNSSDLVYRPKKEEDSYE